jgi:hypothetical protein
MIQYISVHHPRNSYFQSIHMLPVPHASFIFVYYSQIGLEKAEFLKMIIVDSHSSNYNVQ